MSGEDGDRRAMTIGFACGLGFVLLIGAWVWLARPSEDAPTSSGFSFGGAAAGAAGGAAPFARREETGLSYVRIGDIEGRYGPGAASASAAPAAGAPSAGQAAAGSRPSAAAAPSEAALSPKEREVLKAAAGSLGPKEAQALGGSRALWMAAQKVAEYPAVMGFLLNNKFVVDAYMNRADTKEACSNPKAMADYFANTHSDFDVARQMAKANPQVAQVALGSELFQRVANCPGMQGFVTNPALVVGVATNPSALAIITDPGVVSALTANPESSKLFSQFQNSESGGQ
jgi:hypothetical protein